MNNGLGIHPISTYTEQPTLVGCWHAARTLGYPTALWRLPNRTEKELVIDTSGTISSLAMELEDLPPGFAVSPFLNPEGQNTLFLQADLYWRFDEGHSVIAEEVRMPTDHPAFQAFLSAKRQLATRNEPTEVLPTVVVNPVMPGEQNQFEQTVRRAVQQIERNEFRKVVLSRTKAVRFSSPPDGVAIFNCLCAAYPDAFVSAVFLPDRQQVWVGATPEGLVSVDAEGVFRTVALAGTQSLFHADGRIKQPDETQWKQKEIEEQALVGRYIIGCFKQIRLRDYHETGPKTVVAGNLMHLRSDYWVDTQAVNFPQLGTVMLPLLHPTSAVCGMPQKAAQAFILAHESHERELYSGYLGPVNIRQETHLFVNLRCLNLKGREGTLYAGAGLTEGSVPSQEWHETELKCQTLLAILERKGNS